MAFLLGNDAVAGRLHVCNKVHKSLEIEQNDTGPVQARSICFDRDSYVPLAYQEY